jgi:hypothetical protein
MNVNQLELFVLESKKIVEQETKVCYGCKEELPNNFDFFAVNIKNGKKYTKHLCKTCVSRGHKVLNALKKTAPPRPECCELCGLSFEKVDSLNIHLDHCKETETFRGWLCKNCNIGLGMLGDDLEGIHRALVYLNKHKDRIDG